MVRDQGREEDRYMSIQEVRRETGLSITTLRRRMREGNFPLPYRLSIRRVGWKASEVAEWKTNRESGPLPAPLFGRPHRGRDGGKNDAQGLTTDPAPNPSRP
jgi:prophage regulatory protein